MLVSATARLASAAATPDTKEPHASEVQYALPVDTLICILSLNDCISQDRAPTTVLAMGIASA